MTSAAIQDKIDTYAGTGLTLNGNQFDIDTSVVTLSDSQTLIGKTLSSATLTGTLTAGGGTGTSGQVLKSTITGVQWADESGGGGGISFSGSTANGLVSYSNSSTATVSPDVVVGSTAINFNGGYPTSTSSASGGMTLYNYGRISLRNIEPLRFYETNGSGADQFVVLKAPDTLSGSGHTAAGTLTLPEDTGTIATTKDTGIHVVSEYYASTFLVYNYWQSILGSSYDNLTIKLDPSKSSKPRRSLCLCELFTPRTRPHGKLLYFHIKDYQNNVHWDGVGTYIGSTSNPTNGHACYDDTNHQMTMVWKCMIDLSDYGSNWSTTTFRLGVRIKANANNGYIYGNSTGQYIFKVTELASVTNDGTPGGIHN
jgi:hypothetical protein